MANLLANESPSALPDQATRPALARSAAERLSNDVIFEQAGTHEVGWGFDYLAGSCQVQRGGRAWTQLHGAAQETLDARDDLLHSRQRFILPYLEQDAVHQFVNLNKDCADRG